MRYRPLGRTGQYVSEICLGTMTFHGGAGFWQAIGKLDQAGSTALVGRALEAGVNFIDTANVYSEGQSEVQLGQALRDLGVKREDVIVATKVRGRMGPGPNAVGLSRGHIMDQIAAQPEAARPRPRRPLPDPRLRSRDPDRGDPARARRLRPRGLVSTIGCSNLAAWQIMKALAISDENGLARFETVQAYYSIAGRELEREIVPLVEDQGLGVMVWSPLAGGFLSGKFTREKHGDQRLRAARPSTFRRSTRSAPTTSSTRCGRSPRRTTPSVARVALAWLLQRKGVMSVIIGAKTVEQLDDNLAAADLDADAPRRSQRSTRSAR